jgi:hypothetical protein
LIILALDGSEYINSGVRDDRERAWEVRGKVEWATALVGGDSMVALM